MNPDSILFPISLLKLIRYLYLVLGAFVIGISLSLAVVNGLGVLDIILCYMPSSVLIYICFAASSAINDDIQLAMDLEPENKFRTITVITPNQSGKSYRSYIEKLYKESEHNMRDH